jgi:lysophospholipase L1-like esterase
VRITADQLAANTTPTVAVNGFVDGVSNGLTFDTVTGRTYINAGHMSRIRKAGTIDTLEFELSTLTNLLDNSLQFIIYRWNGSTFDAIVASDAIANSELVADWNSLGSTELGATFTSTAVLRGDMIGIFAVGTGSAYNGFLFGTGSTGNGENWRIFWDSSDETTTQGWTPGNEGTDQEWNFNLFAKMTPPMIVGVGDSLMQGTVSGGSNPEGFLDTIDSGDLWKDVNLTDSIIHSLSGFNETLLGGMNHGKGSTDTDDWATTGSDFITTDCVAYNPRYCIINLGVNDISSSFTWATTRANFINIFQTLFSNRIIPIVLSIAQWPNGTEPQQQSVIDFNETLRVLCAEFRIRFIDTYTMLADAADDTNRTESIFGTNTNIHPTSPAYIAMSDLILAELTGSIASTYGKIDALNDIAATDIVTNGAISTSGGVIATVDTTLNVNNSVDANVVQISGDSTAANNLESQYDGTGLTGNTFPSTQAQASGIAVQTTRVDGLIEDSSGDRFTTKALEQGPTDPGAGAPQLK